MTAAAYDIATEHAILVEASVAGKLDAVPAALLFGVALGAVYDLFRTASVLLGVREDAAGADSRIGRLTARLRGCRCRPVRRKNTECVDSQDTERLRRQIPARVVQFFLDILYFLICGVLGAVFLYWRNDGILRWYLVLCGVLGFLAYHVTAGVLVMRGAALLGAAVHAILCTCFNLTLYYLLRLGWRAGGAMTAWLRKQRKRIGVLWQRKRNNRRKKQVSSRRSHFSSSSDSVPSPSFSSTDRSATTKKKLL